MAATNSERKSASQLDYIAKEIRSRLEFAKKHEEKATAMYVSAGALIADAYPHFNTKLQFGSWVEKRIGIGVSWAYELMARHLKPDQLTAMQQRRQEQKKGRCSPASRTDFPSDSSDLPPRKPASNVVSLAKKQVMASDLTDEQWDRVYEFIKTL